MIRRNNIENIGTAGSNGRRSDALRYSLHDSTLAPHPDRSPDVIHYPAQDEAELVSDNTAEIAVSKLRNAVKVDRKRHMLPTNRPNTIFVSGDIMPYIKEINPRPGVPRSQLKNMKPERIPLRKIEKSQDPGYAIGLNFARILAAGFTYDEKPGYRVIGHTAVGITDENGELHIQPPQALQVDVVFFADHLAKLSTPEGQDLYLNQFNDFYHHLPPKLDEYDISPTNISAGICNLVMTAYGHVESLNGVNLHDLYQQACITHSTRKVHISGDTRKEILIPELYDRIYELAYTTLATLSPVALANVYQEVYPQIEEAFDPEKTDILEPKPEVADPALEKVVENLSQFKYIEEIAKKTYFHLIRTYAEKRSFHKPSTPSVAASSLR